MKNLIKITAAVFVVVIAIIAINCTSSTQTDAVNDSTAVVTPDTVVVTGGDSAVVK
jgi:hypothetical protein